MESHPSTDCPEVVVECMKCGEQAKRKDMDDHAMNVCPEEMIECDCGL